MSAKQRKQGSRRLDPRLAAALDRGRRLRSKMATAEGGAMSCGEAARLLKISESALLKRWREHRLVGWSRGKGVFFPRWQFAHDRLLPGVEEILQTFASNDHWRVMGYFLCERLSLNKRRPLDLLREGAVTAIVNHAKAYAHDDVW